MAYEMNHIILAESNFVLAICEGKFARKYTSFYNPFRVQNGYISEYWDAMETITPKSEWKNNNVKFNI